VVNDVFVRADGKILASGLFTQVGNNALFVEPTAVGRIAQLDAAGDLDLEFNPGGDGANNSILDAISLPNGDLLLAGGFTSFNGVDRSRLAVVAGYNGSTLTVTSPSFFAASLGQPVQFAFAANDPTASFSLSGLLPLGITFDAVLGRLIGTAQAAGQFSLQVIATTRLGNSSAPAPFLLTVNSSGPATFAAWQAAHFTSPLPPSAGPHEVLNTRGLSNLLVYALNGGDPRSVQPEVSPVVQEENYAGKNYLTLSAPKNPLALGLVYRVEISTDLVNWTYDSASVVVLSDTASEIKARAAVPVAEAGRQFIRLKVLEP